MLELTDLEPLVGAVLGQFETAVRLAGLSAITHLPLSDEAWMAMGRPLRDMVDQAVPGTSERRRAIEIAARAPLATVRAALQEIGASQHDPDADAARWVLREPSRADVDAYLGRVSGDPPDPSAAKALATLPIESVDLDERPLRVAARSQEPDVGLWAALALARRGKYAALDRILGGKGGPTYLFYGSPWRAYDRLAAMRPVPQGLHDHLVEWLEAHPERQQNPYLIVGGLTGVLDAEGRHVEEDQPKEAPPEPEPVTLEVTIEGLDDVVLRQLSEEPGLQFHQIDPESWASLTRRQASRIVVETVRRVAVEVSGWSSGDPSHAQALGNALVYLTQWLPVGLDLPAPELLRLHMDELRPVIPDSQTAWVMSRAYPRDIVGSFADTLPDLDAGRRVDALDLLSRIGDYQRGAPAPILGAGPGDSGLPVRNAMIDDRHTRGITFGRGVIVKANRPRRGFEFTTPDEPEATATAWPHLEAPVAVVVSRSFPVVVGLGQQVDPLVDGTGPIEVPAADYTLGIELLLDGFAIEGDRTFTLEVTGRDRFPKRTVHLIALDKPGLKEHRRIGVVYRVGQEMRGYAGREVVVKPTAEQASAVAAPAEVPRPGGIDTSPFLGLGAADITIVVHQGAAADGSSLVWTALSPLVDIPIPATAPVSNLGSSPERFLDELVREASTSADALDLFASLLGKGSADIAPLIPGSVQEALRAVADKVCPRPPTVLLLSQDPYVPWELAVLDPPLAGTPADGSPFLGAQAVVGRWVLRDAPPPHYDPPKELTIRAQALVAGVYEEIPDWKRLESAEQEIATLEASWAGAVRVEARFAEVFKCIKGDPPADIIHFALHGQFSIDEPGQGLVLIAAVPNQPDQKTSRFLTPSHVHGGNLKGRRPFVFLNACQVGANRKVLGSYSGMASAFVRIGASGVVAALWSVDDKVASAIALDFYRATLKAGDLPAEAIRAMRARVTLAAVEAGDPHATGTHLAYQFFGHPSMRLATPATAGEGTG